MVKYVQNNNNNNNLEYKQLQPTRSMLTIERYQVMIKCLYKLYVQNVI